MTTDDTTREACPFCERSENCDFDQLYAGVVMRFEPLNPVTPGHMLFMPAEHAEHPHPDALATAIRYAGKYAAERGGDYNLITSSGPAATQTVPHMHIHYVPRHQGDGLHLPWTLAAEKAKWQAEALRDAGAWLDSFEGPGGRTSLHDQVGRDIIRLLRERADRIAREKGSGDER